MADETTTESGQPSGAVVDASGFLAEFNFKSMDEVKNALTSYKTDVPKLREELNTLKQSAAELETLKKQMEEKDTAKLSEVQKAQKAAEEAQNQVKDLNNRLIMEQRNGLLRNEIFKVTQQASPEEAELFTDYVTLKLAKEEYNSAEELAPKMKAIIDKWQKLGQNQTPTRTVPEGHAGHGAPSDGGMAKGSPTFSDRLSEMTNRFKRG